MAILYKNQMRRCSNEPGYVQIYWWFTIRVDIRRAHESYIRVAAEAYYDVRLW